MLLNTPAKLVSRFKPHLTKNLFLHFPSCFLSACWQLQALPNWYILVIATKTLTANRLQFFGMMTSEYRDQMSPVAASDADCGTDSFSTGRFKSPRPANTKAHLNAGAQKKTVFGPASCSQSGLSFAGTALSPTATNAR